MNKDDIYNAISISSVLLGCSESNNEKQYYLERIIILNKQLEEEGKMSLEFMLDAVSKLSKKEFHELAEHIRKLDMLMAQADDFRIRIEGARESLHGLCMGLENIENEVKKIKLNMK